MGKPRAIAEVLDGAVQAQDLLLAADSVLEALDLALDEDPQELRLVLLGVDDLALAIGVYDEVFSDEMILLDGQHGPNCRQILPDHILNSNLHSHSPVT